jgi:hypothetical protein
VLVLVLSSPQILMVIIIMALLLVAIGNADCHGHVHFYGDYSKTMQYYEYSDHKELLKIVEKNAQH